MRRSLWLLVLSLIAFGLVYSFGTSTPFAAYFGATMQFIPLAAASYIFLRTGLSLSVSDRSRVTFIRLACGCIVWTIAQVMEIWELTLSQPGYATIADCFWIMGYFPLLSALLRVYRSTKTKNAAKNLPVIALIAAAYSLLFFLLILPQIRNSQRDLPSRILDAAYPTLDFALVAITALLVWVARSEPISSYKSLLIAFVIWMNADILLGHFNTPDSVIYQTLDCAYFVGYFLLAVAARSQMIAVSRR